MQAEKFFREIRIERKAIDQKSRRVTIAFSSETPVCRGPYCEVLSHDPADVNMTRLSEGAPLLLNHDPSSQIGVVESARIESDGQRKVGRAVVRFGRGELASEVFNDIVDGIRTGVSVGYVHTRIISRTPGKKSEPDTLRVAWQPFELSIATIPADPTVGVGRAATPADLQKRMTTAAKPNAQEQISEMLEISRQLIKDRPDLKADLEDLQSRAVVLEEPLDEFRRCAMELVTTRRKPETRMPLMDFEIGMSQKDIGQYSLARAIRSALNTGRVEGFEAECSQQVEKTSGQKAVGFFVPSEVNLGFNRREFLQRQIGLSQRDAMLRDLQATNFAAGGAMVETQLLPLIEILRNKARVLQLGARMLSGLQGNMGIPRQTSTSTASSLSEIAALGDSNPTLDQLLLQPKRIGATCTFSKQLLIQSSTDVENFVRDDLLKVVALRMDLMAINGQGANSEPLGVINTPGVGSIVFNGSASYGKMVDMETAIAAMNAPDESRGYLTTSTAKGALKKLAKLLTGATTVTAVAIWEDGEINGYQAFDSQQVPGNIMIFGAWAELLIGQWAGYDVVVDPYTKAKNAEVVVTINSWIDTALRHAQSFCVSADSAAQ